MSAEEHSMLILGQAPSGRSGDVSDVLTLLRSYVAPDDGGQDAGGAGGTGDSGAGQGSGTETGKDGTPFDAERAQRTIDRQTEELRTLRAQAKELADARTRLKEIEDKDKSEVERLAGSAKEASEKLTAAEARARDLAIRLAVAETATTIGITGASVKAAVRLLDQEALEFDDDGSPTNVEPALKALVKEYPMLAAQAEDGEPKKPGTQGVPATPKPNGRTPTASEREQQDLEGLRATGRYSV